MPRRPANLDAFFNPESVAVLGASRTPGKAGHQQIVNLKRGYRGTVIPINPGGGNILGIETLPSVMAAPVAIDLAIILIPALQVPAAVLQCVQANIPAVLIGSAGFAEAGAEGKALQDRVLEVVRGTGTRVWGPNCNGLVNTASNLLASFVDLPAIRPGGVGIVSQTGIFAAAFLNQLMEIPSFGVSKVATLGNICDIDEVDLLEYLADDNCTEVIALYLEGFRDGRRLIEICRELTRHKPVVALTSGRTEAGARASMSHTASLAADARVTRNALSQAGVVLAHEFTELADLAHAFACARRVRRARNVAILTTTGGAGVVATDQLASNGLSIAALSPETERRLAAVHPLAPGASNPLDIWPAMQARGTNNAVSESMRAVLADPNIDAAVLIMGAFSGGGTDFEPRVIADAMRASGKPTMCWLYGPAAYTRAWEAKLAEASVPVFRDLRTIANALAASDMLARYRERPAGVARSGATAASASTSAIVSPARRARRKSLTEPEAYRLLEAWGVRAPAWRLVTNGDEAVGAARAIGFPVVVKIVSPHLIHKSDVGGVAVGLADDLALEAAIRSMRTAVGANAPDAAVEGFLVQRMVRPSIELIVGMVRTPQFGPAVMVGLGGRYAEAIGRVEFLLPPFTADDVERAIDASGVGRLLDANRPLAATRHRALGQVIAVLGDLSASEPHIDQIEINPLIVTDDEAGVFALDAVVVLD